MTNDEFKKSVMDDFWDWCNDNKDYIIVEMHRDTLYLYLALEHDIINAFVDYFQGSVEECGLDCNLQMNSICIDVEKFMGGCGFTMKELWENRPYDLEFNYW